MVRSDRLFALITVSVSVASASAPHASPHHAPASHHAHPATAHHAPHAHHATRARHHAHHHHLAVHTAPPPLLLTSSATAPAPLANPGATRSSGCGNASAPTGVHDGTLTVRGADRTYLLSVPAQYDPSVPLPLVFAWHGLTGTPASLRQYLHLERETGNRAIVVYPAGLREPSTDAGLGHTRWDLRPDGDDVAFFDALLHSLGETYCVDTSRVFGVGHSAGAVVANAMGCLRGETLRAIAPIAGSGPWSRHCTAPPAVWLTHGRADPKVAFHYGEASRDHWVAAAACEPRTVPIADTPCEQYVGCSARASVVWCPTDGDHGVPAFAPHAIWSFFTGLR